MGVTIQFLDAGDEPKVGDAIVVTYVGGPHDGEREVVHGRLPPSSIVMPQKHGVYEMSVRCADDGALRYVWVPSGPKA